MLDNCGIISMSRLITGASYLTPLTPCYTMQMPALSACDESRQPSRLDGAGFVLSREIDMKTWLVCVTCGNSFSADRNVDRRKFCSLECRYGATAEERFWKKVNKSDECWNWIGAKSRGGYGSFGGTKAHRYAYELANGSIPEGLFVCHKCDNPGCVRPDHLFLGTPKDNTDDMWAKNRARPGKLLHPSGVDHWTKRQPNRIRYGEEAPNTKLTEENIREIRRRYFTEGMLQDELATEYGVTSHTIGDIVRNDTWKHLDQDDDFVPRGKNGWRTVRPERVLVGERSARATLSDDQAREIRKRYAGGGIRQTDLAAEYGVSRQVVGAIVTSKQWKHISDGVGSLSRRKSPVKK
jgi:DNA-binding XRE family transcriptional regulator